MSSVAKEKIKLYEMLLSSPGMEEKCKVMFSLSRRNILLICQFIEAGLQPGKEGEGVTAVVSPEVKEELQVVVPQLLERGNLTAFYEKLKSL